MRNIKDNLISVLIGVALSIPICIGAHKEQLDREEPKVEYHELTTVETIDVSIEEVEVTEVAEATPESTPTKTYDSIDLIALCTEPEAGVSNSQLYKQAGNSICVSVLEAIYKSLGERYEEFKSLS